MTRKSTCSLCPTGCQIEQAPDGGEILSLAENRCPKGGGYARQAIRNPMRSIASPLAVEGGHALPASMRLRGPISKRHSFDGMEVVSGLWPGTPVPIGQTLVPDVPGLGQDVIATREVKRA